MSVNGTQTDDEKKIADIALPIVRMRPGINVIAITGNINIASRKTKFGTEEIYRALASDDRFHSDRDPESGLTRFYLKEQP